MTVEPFNPCRIWAPPAALSSCISIINRCRMSITYIRRVSHSLSAPSSTKNPKEMADPTAQEAVAKTRIITHMNNDHQDSLIRLLEHFCHLSSFSSRNARLTDITYDNLTIQTGNGLRPCSYSIPIFPAMTSWADARGKLVALDATATAGLNRSKITVKKYVKPTGFMAVIAFLVVFTIAIFSRSANFEPGSWLYDYLWAYIPGFARSRHRMQFLLLFFMLGVHGVEAAWMIKSRLRKHTVPTFSKLWCAWVFSSFFEGAGSFVRFDRIVEEETLRKEKLKH